jgi:hypothetical protein
MTVTLPPIWLVALVVAALAPWAAGALQKALERRVRRRTLALLARALPPTDTPAAKQGSEAGR